MDAGSERDSYLRLRREFDAFLCRLPYGVLEVELDSGDIVYLNQAACGILGLDPGVPRRTLTRRDVLPGAELASAFDGPSAGPLSPEMVETSALRGDGVSVPIEAQVSYTNAIDGRAVRARVLFRALASPETNGEPRLVRLCAWCRRIRNDRGEWQQLESYLRAELGYEFTHGICAQCDGRLGVEGRAT